MKTLSTHITESFDINESASQYAVKMVGGSVGENRPRDAKGYKGQPVPKDEKLYDSLEAAKTEAKEKTKRHFSPGERKHYGLKYVPVGVNDGKFV